MQNTMLNTQKYEEITLLILALRQNKTAIWKDRYGDYKIFIGKNIIKTILGKNNEYRLLKTDNLTNKINKLIRINENSEKIVSIGSFQTHNNARNIAKKENKKIITIPVPISNDSFGTNRYVDDYNSASIESVYPTMTIFDLEIIQTVDLKTNILGIGEFIGLYYSILDYSYCNKVEYHSILEDIKNNFFKICGTSSNNNKLIDISILLIYKCLIMRVNEDHTIGCGIDHLFANVLEKTNNLAHGKAVYLGSIISSIIIPDWRKYGIDTKILIENGQKINLIDNNDLLILKTIEILQIIENAIKTRPNRKTILHDIDKSTIKKLWLNSINKLTWVI